MRPKSYLIEFLASSLLIERLDYCDQPTPHFVWKNGQNKGKRAGFKKQDGYRVITVGGGERQEGVKMPEHRLVWFYHYRKIPEGQIDHINGVRDDNRIENLRDVSARENSRNAKTHRGGHLWGTVFHSNGWTAAISYNGKRLYIGRYKTQLEAHQAARNKSIELGLDTFK